jgi:sugar phosphate isomerase/epimerase
MKIGCFALIQPFSPMRRQFELIRELGFDYADLTDTVDGMSRILDALGHEETVGINLDTGNSWLGHTGNRGRGSRDSLRRTPAPVGAMKKRSDKSDKSD